MDITLLIAELTQCGITTSIQSHLPNTIYVWVGTPNADKPIVRGHTFTIGAYAEIPMWLHDSVMASFPTSKYAKSHRVGRKPHVFGLANDSDLLLQHMTPERSNQISVACQEELKNTDYSIITNLST